MEAPQLRARWDVFCVVTYEAGPIQNHRGISGGDLHLPPLVVCTHASNFTDALRGYQKYRILLTRPAAHIGT